jgi:hypothetical protein
MNRLGNFWLVSLNRFGAMRRKSPDDCESSKEVQHPHVDETAPFIYPDKSQAIHSKATTIIVDRVTRPDVLRSRPPFRLSLRKLIHYLLDNPSGQNLRPSGYLFASFSRDLRLVHASACSNKATFIEPSKVSLIQINR